MESIEIKAEDQPTLSLDWAEEAKNVILSLDEGDDLEDAQIVMPLNPSQVDQLISALQKAKEIISPKEKFFEGMAKELEEWVEEAPEEPSETIKHLRTFL